MNRNLSERHPSWDLIRKTLAGGGLGSWRAELDAEGKVLIAFDEAFLTLTGLIRSELPETLEDYLKAFLPTDQARMVDKLMAETLAGTRADFSCEHRLNPPSRRPLWVKVFGQVETRDPAGRPTGLFGFLQDITENKQNMAELAASKERLDAVVNGAKIGIWDWNVTEDEVSLSRVFSDLIGVPYEDLAGTIGEWYDLMHPEDLPLARETMEQALSGGLDSYRLAFRLRHSSGPVMLKGKRHESR